MLNLVLFFKLRSIPTVGTSDPLTSYIGAYRFQKRAKDMVQEGYYKVIRWEIPSSRI